MVSFAALLIGDGERKTFAHRFVELLSCGAELHQSDKRITHLMSNLGNLLYPLSARPRATSGTASNANNWQLGWSYLTSEVFLALTT